MLGHAWPLVRWLLVVQIGLTALAAFGVTIGLGVSHGLATLLGGSIALILTAVFALRAFTGRQDEPKQALMAMVRGETLKLVLAAIAFVAVAKLMPQFFGPVLIGYVAATISFWLALPMASGLIGDGQNETPAEARPNDKI